MIHAPQAAPPPPPPRTPPPKPSPAAWFRLLIPAILGLVADLWMKSYAFPSGVPEGKEARLLAGINPAYASPPKPIIPNILDLHTTINEGAVFGFAQGHVTLFLIFSIFAMAIILWVFATSYRNQWTVHLALGLITAGALGNVYDRATFHGVRDMLRFTVKWYPYIFNIADALLCLGVPLLILRWLFIPDPKTPKPPPTI